MNENQDDARDQDQGGQDKGGQDKGGQDQGGQGQGLVDRVKDSIGGSGEPTEEEQANWERKAEEAKKRLDS